MDRSRSPLPSPGWPLIGLAALAGAAGCELGPPPSAELIDSQQYALEQTSGEVICTPGELSWQRREPGRENACAGSWVYARYRQCEVASEACGPLRCDAYQRCRRWAFGEEQHVHVERTTLAVSRPPQPAPPHPYVLERELAGLVELVDAYLHPIVALRYPDMPARMRKDAGAELDALLEVRPRDLYSTEARSGGLFCFEHAPVVESLALYAVLPDSDASATLNPLRPRLPVVVDAHMLYPDQQGPRVYRLTGDAWRPLGVRLMAGEEASVLATVAALETAHRVGDGLSPFSTFVVDVTGLDPRWLESASALLVVFELRSRVSTDDMTWLETCQ